MITELALIAIKQGSEAQFLDAFEQAQRILAASEGYIAHALRRSIEDPRRFMLTVEWRTLNDHTVGFRGSEAFVRWRALIGPFFHSPPVVEHFA